MPTVYLQSSMHGILLVTWRHSLCTPITCMYTYTHTHRETWKHGCKSALVGSKARHSINEILYLGLCPDQQAQLWKNWPRPQQHREHPSQLITSATKAARWQACSLLLYYSHSDMFTTGQSSIRTCHQRTPPPASHHHQNGKPETVTDPMAPWRYLAVWDAVWDDVWVMLQLPSTEIFHPKRWWQTLKASGRSMQGEPLVW